MSVHRCSYYPGMVLLGNQRAQRELPLGLWLDLHAYFAAAEEKGVATLSIPDALDPQGRSTHCTAAFISLLLSELAGPYSLSIRDQNLTRRWANRDVYKRQGQWRTGYKHRRTAARRCRVDRHADA